MSVRELVRRVGCDGQRMDRVGDEVTDAVEDRAVPCEPGQAAEVLGHDRDRKVPAARRVARTIYEGCASLQAFPNLGRTSLRLAGRRELVFPPLPYIVVYQVTQETVEISRIFHGAQDWP